jgi:hypothetical protein
MPDVYSVWVCDQPGGTPMTVHARPAEIRHPVTGIGHSLMLAIGLVALIALLAMGAMILLDAVPTTVDANILQVEKLQELRTALGGGGFI